jgi:hypothetical protein
MQRRLTELVSLSGFGSPLEQQGQARHRANLAG